MKETRVWDVEYRIISGNSIYSQGYTCEVCESIHVVADSLVESLEKLKQHYGETKYDLVSTKEVKDGRKPVFV